MARNLITEAKIKSAVRTAKTRGDAVILWDGDGLRYRVAPSGVVSAQLKHGDAGKYATLGKIDRLGGLAAARKKADEWRGLAEEGIDLTQHKRETKLKRKIDGANTFGRVASAWVTKRAKAKGWAPHYREEVEASLRNHLSDLDALPVTKVTAAIVMPLLDKVERSAPLMIEKVWHRLNGVLDHAVWRGMIERNPLPANLDKESKAPRRNFPAVTKPEPLGEILRAARAADPCKGIQRAHLLLAFTAQRVSEVVDAKWDEFALDGVDVMDPETHRTHFDPQAGNWSVPRERMKVKEESRGPHVVPLPPALLAQLREWRTADGPDAVYVCVAPRDPSKAITEEAVEKHYRRALNLAGRHSPHSWRSALKSISSDAGKDIDATEAQLDHVVGSKVASVYDRNDRLERRRALMTWYEGRLIAARDGADVTPIRAAKHA